MFDTNIKHTHTKLFPNRVDETISSNDQISTPNLLRQQSLQSLHKINKHYKEFQHALHMLKISVEELWRLELKQLHNNKSISPNPSNIRFNLQVPSIYACRAVLPMVNETIPLENKISSSINSPNVLQPTPTASLDETMSNKTETKEKMSPSSTQSIFPQQNSTRSLLSISKKRKQYESSDKFTKYWSKTALLHLKFRCSKHIC
jgi:hypothetical protein